MADKEQELTPEREAQVRRLLSQAKADEPAPPDVVRRLDRVLDGLAAEGAITTPDPVDNDPAVVDLTARRRRRVASLLLAAAAVFVVATGVNQIVGGSSGDEAASTALQSDDAGATDAQEAPDRAEAGDDSLSEFAETEPAEPGESADLGGPPAPESALQTTAAVAPYGIRLRGGGLAKAIQRVVKVTKGAPVGDSGYVTLTPSTRLGQGLTRVDEFACTPAAWGPGRLVPVLYKGTPNVLAVREPEGKTQVVEVLQCGTGEVVRSLTLSAKLDR